MTFGRCCWSIPISACKSNRSISSPSWPCLAPDWFGQDSMGMDVRAMTHAAKLAEWSEKVQVCRSSGMTVREWCEQNHVCSKTYYTWERVYLAEVSRQLAIPERSWYPATSAGRNARWKSCARTCRWRNMSWTFRSQNRSAIRALHWSALDGSTSARSWSWSGRS